MSTFDKLGHWPISGPWAVAAGLALSFITTYLAASAGAWIALRPLRSYRGDHWAERARRAYPARLVAFFNCLALPALAVLQAFALLAVTSDRVVWAIASACGVGSLAGAVVVWFRVQRRVGLPPPGLRSWLRLQAVVLLLGVPNLVVMLVLLVTLPHKVNSRAVGMLAAGTIVVACFSVGGGLNLLRWMGVARPSAARLTTVVAGAASRASAQPRTIYQLDLPMANAFAFPALRCLAFTDLALAALDDAELAAITAHELAHLSEPRAVVGARLAGGLIVLALAASLPIGGSYGLIACVATISAALGAANLLKRLGRRMEVRADGEALALEPDPGTYARALEKLYRTNMLPAVMRGKRGMHPHLYDRLIASGITPDFERPAPPPRWSFEFATFVSAQIALLPFYVGLSLYFRPG